MRPAPPVAKMVALAEGDDLAGFHFQGDDAEHLALRVADQVERHPFDENWCWRARCAGTAHAAWRGRCGRRPRRHGGPAFAEVRHVTTERALVDLALVGCGRTACRSARARPPLRRLLHMNSIASWSPSQSDP